MVNDVLPWRKMEKNVWEIGGPEPDVCTIPMYLSYECLSALQKKEKLFLFSNQISRGKKLMLLYDACFHAFLILTELSWRVNFIAWSANPHWQWKHILEKGKFDIRILTSNNSSQETTSVTLCWLVDILQWAQIRYVCCSYLLDLPLGIWEGGKYLLKLRCLKANDLK